MASLPPLLVDADGPPGGPAVVSLRRHTLEDAPRVHEQCTDPLSVAWTTVPTPYTLEQAVGFVRDAMPGGWESDREWGFALDVDGRFGGTVSLRPEGGGRAEVAYGAHPDVRGTGAVERALRLLLTWGFDEQGVRTAVWWANRGNWASRRLAWRLGFDIAPAPVRGYLDHRGELVDAWVGTLLSTDERSPRRPWLHPPTIESPRLPVRVRALRESDVPRLVEGVDDAETRQWLADVPETVDAAGARESLLVSGEEAAAGTGLSLAVAAADDDRLLARFNVFGIGRFGAELGYWTHPAERGRGVATEGARLITRHALLPVEDGGLGLDRLTAHAALANAASRAVLAGAGFTEVGVERHGTRTRDGFADALLVEHLGPA